MTDTLWEVAVEGRERGGEGGLREVVGWKWSWQKMWVWSLSGICRLVCGLCVLWFVCVCCVCVCVCLERARETQRKRQRHKETERERAHTHALARADALTLHRSS